MDKHRKIEAAFLKAAAPIFKALTDVKNREVPKITLFPDGGVEYEYSDKVKKIEEACFKKISIIKQSLLNQVLSDDNKSQRQDTNDSRLSFRR